MSRRSRWIFGVLALTLLAGALLANWWLDTNNALPPGFALANGRIEATEVDVATKTAGRVQEILVDEGDSVRAGQVLARMNTDVLEAQRREAAAELDRAREQLTVADAVIVQRDLECAFAQRELQRVQRLVKQGHVSEEVVDRNRTDYQTAKTVCVAARAQAVEAEAGIHAARAKVERLEVELEDAELKAPRSGRVLFRLAEPGEVLPAGGKVLTLIDLDDVHMMVFLPAHTAGRLRVGADARLVLDALPERPVPAKVSFIADKAQFTPKHVETAKEREKLMFRAKVRALANPQGVLKPGMPGLAYLRQIDAGDWPAALQ